MTTRERNERKKLAHRNALTDITAHKAVKSFVRLRETLIASGSANILGYEHLRLPSAVRNQLKRNGVWC